VLRYLKLLVGFSLFSLAFLFFLYPAAYSLWNIVADPGIRTGAPTKIAFRMHRDLSEKLPSYVDERIKSGLATTLDVSQIEATEWPVYGAFFYLLSTEN